MATPSAAPQQVKKVVLFKKAIAMRQLQDQSYFIDPYTGALASAIDKNTFLSNLDAEIARLNPVGANSRLLTPQRISEFNYLKQQREYIASRPWKQYENLDASIAEYGDDWNKFFQAQYQNPRIEEENKVRKNRANQELQRKSTLYDNLQDLMIEASGSPSQKRVRNTGVTTRSDVFGGSLEAGLGV